MRYSVWKNGDSTSLTMLPEGRDPHYDADDPPTLVTTFEADSWEEAMQEYHRLMGWEPYSP